MANRDVVLEELIQAESDTATYRGHLAGDGTRLILKVTTEEHPRPRTLARLRHEHALLVRQGGDGIPRSMGLQPYGNGLMLMIEALDGRPLDAILRGGPMPPERAIGMAIGVLSVLNAVHGRHIVHKDIKPGNILVNEATGAVSIVDFGIASELPRAVERPAATGIFEGTPVYMSPEQTGLIDAFIDARSDIYSLGATLYEALTGVPPFDGTEPEELFVAVLTRTPRPPHEVTSGVPAQLSAIVMKALAKNPEERYQSAYGFSKDLETCALELRSGGGAATLRLGLHDIVSEPRPPQRLHGRAAEIAAFQAAFERASGGAAELVLVSGDAGIGKSALIREVRRTIAQHGATLAEGKCDQLERARPHSAIARAMRDLASKLLAMPEGKLSAMRSRLLVALGAQGKVLTDLAPELERVIGEQPEAPAVGSTEAQNRFILLIQRFFRVFAEPGRPLVVFLDDLQWSDAASLALVRGLLRDPARGHLLVVGGHRDVDEHHPLAQLPKDARAAGITPVALRLGPLDADAMREFVADALGGDRAALAPLADQIFAKTAGNPFFSGQFLEHIHREGLVRFDRAAGGFVFDAAAIAALPGTDNVLSLLAGELSALPEETRGVLVRAACLGHRFDLGRLARTCAATRRQTARALDPALSLGLVLALDQEHRFYVDEETSGAAVDFDVTYRFLHDRVQQAAYALVDGEARQALHLEIGRSLLTADRSDDGVPFEAIQHLGLGAALIDDAAERVSVARLHHAAGRSAKRSAAFDLADKYLSAGMAMLRESDLDADPTFAFAFALEAAECAFLAGDAERAEQGYAAVHARASSALERAEVERQRVVFFTTIGRYPDALAAARRGLSALGVALPEGEESTKQAVEQAIGAAQAALAARSLDALADAPVSSDPLEVAIARLYIAAFPVTFFLDPPLNVLVTAQHFTRALERGHTEYSSHAYATYGSVSAILLGAYEQALSLGKLALSFVERHPAGLKAQILNMYGVFIAHHTQPIADCIEVLERGIQAGLETGDFEFASYSCINECFFRSWQGQDALSLLDDIDRLTAIVGRTRWPPLATAIVTTTRQLSRMLAGRTRAGLEDESFDEEAFAREIDKPGFELARLWLSSARAVGCFHAADYAGALASITEGLRYPAAAMGTSLPKQMVFYAALTRLLLRQETGAAKEGDDAALAAEIEQLESFARLCPSSFEHERLLIAAEQAWMREDPIAGMSHHERSMALARESKAPQHEALAAELCARHCLRQGWNAVAADLVARAYAIYSSAGYELMAQRLSARHEDFMARSRPAAGKGLLRATAHGPAMSATGRHTLMGTLDASAALEAAEALGTEVDLDRLLSRLLGLVLSGGGAQRAVLLLVRDEGLRVEGEATLSPNRISVGLGVRFEAYEELPASVIHYSARSGETVRIADAPVDDQFGLDPYVVSRSPRSILCIPLLHRGLTIGVLYVENQALRGAFAGPRVDLLHVLAHQAAISVENTRLYDQIRTASAALEEANAALSEEAERRAAALRDATGELSRTNDRLRHELAERERAERARASLQEEMMRAQQERLEELSTPLIPITDQIMVMPLIGMMDAPRAQRMLEAALEGASKRGVTAVIIDVTGVRSIDTAVARVLLDTATALRLLGAEAVITGIRPMAAQTLVSMGSGLSAIATLGTLQAGIAYALARTGASLGGRPTGGTGVR